MKYLLFILILFVTSCTTIKEMPYDPNFSIKDELNKSIIDGFFDGDTTNIPLNTYFLR